VGVKTLFYTVEVVVLRPERNHFVFHFDNFIGHPAIVMDGEATNGGSFKRSSSNHGVQHAQPKPNKSKKRARKVTMEELQALGIGGRGTNQKNIAAVALSAHRSVAATPRLPPLWQA
jgi:hypothetical protein